MDWLALIIRAPSRAGGDAVTWQRIFLFVSSSSPAGGSPVRVAARRPGSRLAAPGGNARRRSPASKALYGGATMRSAA